MKTAVAVVQTLLLVALFAIFYIVTPRGILWQSILSSLAGLVGGLLFNNQLYDLLEAFLQRVLARFRRPLTYKPMQIDLNDFDSLSGELLSGLPHRGSELWVVLSSKGGVGKSLISLGLTELLSRDGSTLLVDFDLQNRGLTSLLNRRFEYEGSIMNLMIEFEDFVKHYKDSDSPIPDLLNSTKEPPEKFSLNDYNALVAGFSVDRSTGSSARTDHLPARIINFNKLSQGQGRSNGGKGSNPDNALFLRSRSDDPSEGFIFSSIAKRGLPFTTYFLKALCALAGNLPVSRIVLDCHGAHDMLTAGAILAADKTIVVSTTDPGCYEGTVEVVKNVTRVAKQDGRDSQVVYVVNRVGTLDSRIQDIRELISKVPGNHEIVEIPESSEIRDIPKNYHFGAILSNSLLAAKLEMIRDYLVSGKQVETATAAMRWQYSPENPNSAVTNPQANQERLPAQKQRITD